MPPTGHDAPEVLARERGSVAVPARIHDTGPLRSSVFGADAGARVVVRPDEGARSVTGKLIARLLQFGLDEDAVSLTREAELQVRDLTVGPSHVALVVEPEPRRGGRGSYLLRLEERSAKILQAPHAFYDLDTDRIALAMFVRSSWRAAFLNTAHRHARYSDESTPAGVHALDVCHTTDHDFSFASEGALAALEGAVIVQLHGFGRGGPDDAEAVVSAGTERVGNPMLRAVASRLREATGFRVLRFPDETRSLGATTNVQARLVALYAHRGARFVHIELSRDARQRLIDDTRLLAKFDDALHEAIGAGDPGVGDLRR